VNDPYRPFAARLRCNAARAAQLSPTYKCSISYSITSLAAPNSVGGMVRPSFGGLEVDHELKFGGLHHAPETLKMIRS
jgi:hypothetical protein